MTGPAGTGAAGFDPFELPDTIQLGAGDDPYPHLAAARRNGPVQLEWPLPDPVGTVDEDGDPSLSVLGHDEVMAVLRDYETYSSKFLAEIMGPMLGHTMIAMDEPEHRAHRALVARRYAGSVNAMLEDPWPCSTGPTPPTTVGHRPRQRASRGVSSESGCTQIRQICARNWP